MKLLGNTLKSAALAAIVGVSLSGMSQQVQADALAFSYLDVNNAVLKDSNGTIVDSSIFANLIFSNTSDAASTLNGSGSNSSDEKTLLDLPDLSLDLYESTGVAAPADNAFTILSSPATAGTQFAVQDTQLTGTIMNFPGVPTSGAFADVYSAVSLTGEGSGSAQGNVENHSTIEFQATTDLDLTFSFDINYYIETWLSADAQVGSLASAAYSFEVTISQIGGGTLDSYTLTDNDSSQAPLQVIDNYQDSGSVSGSVTATLTAGNYYKLDIVQKTDTNAVNVPEPTSLALLGLGLIGFGVASRKRKA